ncbi:hypothetical protein Pint_07480 [Pistacia integerrima]|uniref:Uncharacterized protein n=1 Tax=Pistacia integerrima TaxID=434235 RepID=A0ACC0Y021_9ROSI|nr:hypothetical protein Pint_07480 [Pistacia integerrima]
MRNVNVRVALEAWNFCNEVGFEAPGMGSPRLADCANFYCPSISTVPDFLDHGDLGNGLKCGLLHKVSEPDNRLKSGDKFPVADYKSYTDPDLFGRGKGTISCFSITYDLDGDFSKGMGNNSFFSVSWKRSLSTRKWIFSHRLTTSAKYPWLMLYLRADATKGFNGGYHYNGRGIMSKLPESPNFKVRLTLDVKHGGGSNSQFYLLDIGSCWKNSGEPSREMLNSWRNHMISVTLVAIHKHRNWYKFFHILNGQCMVILKSKEDGWIGDSRTWELDVGPSRVAYTSPDMRIQEQNQQGVSGLPSMLVQKYMSAQMERLQNGPVSDFDLLVPKDDTYNGHSSY